MLTLELNCYDCIDQVQNCCEGSKQILEQICISDFERNMLVRGNV